MRVILEYNLLHNCIDKYIPTPYDPRFWNQVYIFGYFWVLVLSDKLILYHITE